MYFFPDSVASSYFGLDLYRDLIVLIITIFFSFLKLKFMSVCPQTMHITCQSLSRSYLFQLHRKVVWGVTIICFAFSELFGSDGQDEPPCLRVSTIHKLSMTEFAQSFAHV